MKKNFLLLSAMALAGLFASCSQTEMEEPANVPQKGNEVTVTVAPSADFTQPRTRTESNQQLRYIAELWEEDKTTNPTNPTTKKLIARTEQVGADANKFTFNVEQQGDYVILFWADYIAANASKSTKTIARSSGENTFSVSFDGYEDKDFTTNAESTVSVPGEGLQKVTMNKTASYIAVYNRTLDGFCGRVAFTKGTDIVSIDQVTLKRPLCQYILKEKTADLSAITTINIKSIIFGFRYNIYTEKVTSPSTYTNDSDDNYDIHINILSSSEQKLFSFYSFGEKSEKTLGTLLNNMDIKFNCTASGKNYKYTEINSGQIPCRANYIYTLSGSFVQEDLTGPAVNVDVTCDDGGWTEGSKDLDN